MPRRTSARRLDEDRRLFASYRTTRDAALREALMARFLPLARHLARRFRGAAEDLEDLEQVAAIGLLNAIDRYDPERGTTFATFAVPTITGELLRHLRDTGWAVHVPRPLQERASRVERAAYELEHELAGPPTVAQLAERTGMTARQVQEAQDVRRARHGVSLDRPHDDEGVTLGEEIGVTDHGFRGVEDALAVEQLLASLSAPDQAIVRLRFLEGRTQVQIAEWLGVSEMSTSRLVRRALARLSASAELPLAA